MLTLPIQATFEGYFCLWSPFGLLTDRTLQGIREIQRELNERGILTSDLYWQKNAGLQRVRRAQ